MAGDPQSVANWKFLDVYVADDRSDLTFDASGDFTGGDEDAYLVGFVDGETGINHTREMESNERFAYGGFLIKTIDRNIRHGFTFQALEDNAVTRSLAWPGSTDTVVKVARPAMKYVALRQEEDGLTRIRTSRLPVRVAVDGEIPENETDVTALTFAATLYPDREQVLWDQRLIGSRAVGAGVGVAT